MSVPEEWEIVGQQAINRTLGIVASFDDRLNLVFEPLFREGAMPSRIAIPFRVMERLREEDKLAQMERNRA